MNEQPLPIIIIPTDTSSQKVSLLGDIQECQNTLKLLHSIDAKECFRGVKMPVISDMMRDIKMREIRLVEQYKKLFND